jgi:hypothetical protein
VSKQEFVLKSHCFIVGLGLGDPHRRSEADEQARKQNAKGFAGARRVDASGTYRYALSCRQQI